MKLRIAAIISGGIFVFGLALTLSFANWSVRERDGFSPVFDDQARDLRSSIFALYGGPIGALVGGAAATRKHRGSVPRPLAWLLIVAILVWVLVVLVPVAEFAIGSSKAIESCLKDLQSIREGAPFLISGVLTFFFGTAHPE